MSISSLAAAREMCRANGWRVSNLELQKLLYITQMLSLGRSQGADPLINSRFQAWDLGPVIPDVYHRAKAFGDNPVPDVFKIADYPTGKPKRLIEEVAESFADYSPYDLVEFTHWPYGAWAKHYMPGIHGIVIPNKDIVDEYRKRTH